MCVIALWKVNNFSSDKVSYEPTFIFAYLWEKTYVVILFTPIRYVILLQILFHLQIILNI